MNQLLWWQRWIFLLLVVGSGQLALTNRPLFAQPPSQWSTPIALVETTGRASNPEVVVDSAGTPHVFWEYGAEYDEEDGAGQAIYYATLHDGVWSQPMDVVVSPGNRIARLPNVVLDAQGLFHLVWSGSDAIFYSQADVQTAGTARGWSTPLPLNGGAASLEPAIALSPSGQINVVWTQGGAGLMFSRSTDGGENWSNPTPIFLAPSNRELALWGRVTVDETGRIHAVLTHSLSNDQSSARPDPNFLYYVRSEDGGVSWTEPFLVTDSPDFGQITVVTVGTNKVHLIWNGRAGIGGRYHRWSENAGTTWSEVETVISSASLYGDGGLTGFPAVAIDSRNGLHLVSSANRNNFYTYWNDPHWTVPVNISPNLDGWGVTHTTQTLEAVALAIGQGNRLHVVFHDGFERIWYTARTLNVPALSVPPPTSSDATLLPPSNLPPPKVVLDQPSTTTPSQNTPTGSQPTPKYPLSDPISTPPAFLPLLYGMVGSTGVILILLAYQKQRKR